MKIEPLEIGFGAAALEISVKQLADDDLLRLRQALVDYGLIIVRDQALTPEEHIQASQLFGKLEVFPASAVKLPGFPQIYRVASRREDGHAEIGRYWHSDGTYREIATSLSIWHSVVVPAVGGCTKYTDLQRAYRELPLALRDEVTALRSRHHNGVEHEMVIHHPYTGKVGLYLNIHLAPEVVGYDAESSKDLLARLDTHFSRHGAVYEHHWQANDFVISDNFRIAHQATPIDPKYRRILNRTTVRGDATYWPTHTAT